MTAPLPPPLPRRDSRGPVANAVSAGEDRLEVLRMVESGAVTADEAARLLDALDRSERLPPLPPVPGMGSGTGRGGPTAIRIRVSDSGSGRSRVNLTLPLGLIDVGLGMVRRFAPDRLGEAETIRGAVFSGMRGHVIDVENETGERVEIIVE